MAGSTATTPIEIGARRSSRRRIGDLWAHRTLAADFVRRDLRVRYKGTSLGILWSLLNPLLYMLVFSIVFTEILRVKVPQFGLFLLTGLVAWDVLASSATKGTLAIIENGPLIRKVWFPREILPLATVGAGLVDMAAKAIVLLAGLAAFGRTPDLAALGILAVAVIVLLTFSLGLCLLVSSLSVRFRDIKHLTEVALTAWFWLSAVVYPYASVVEPLGSLEKFTALNPMIPVVTTFQRVLYNPTPDPGFDAVFVDYSQSWFLGRLLVAFAISILVLALGFWTFGSQERDFGDLL